MEKVILFLISASTQVLGQAVIRSQRFEITQSADFSPEYLLDIHLNDTILADQVFDHGCFCSKIYH